MTETMTANTNITLTLKDFAEYDAAMVIWHYISPLLLLVGTVGSILSVVVLSRTRLHSVTTKFYLIQLAYNDVIVLNLGLLHYWMDYTFSFNIRNISSFACKVHTLAVTLFLDYSAWILVMLTVDRCIYICLPGKELQFYNIRNARIVSAVVFLMLLAVNMHFLWTYDVVDTIMFGRTTDCDVGRQEYKYFVEYVWPWIELCVFSSIPFVIMVVGNSLILRQLGISDKKLQDHREQSSHSAKRQSVNSNVMDTSTIPEASSLATEVLPEVILHVMDPIPQANAHVIVPMPDENLHVTDAMTEANSRITDPVREENSLVTDLVSKTIRSKMETTEGPQTVKPISSNVLSGYYLQQDRRSPPANSHVMDAITEENLLISDSQSKTIPSKLGTTERRMSVDLKMTMTKQMSKLKSISSQILSRGRHAKLALMLLSINCMFLLLTSPIVIYLILLSHWQVSPDVHEEAELVLGWAIVSVLQYANNSIHFFQYYLTIPSFYKEFWSTFRKPRNVPNV
ncbi:uncharacterized protein LOC121371594 [Gigantopelta aegis]|uniref:uncharacterized protein LOC121371594 n=1 Tax=Gigantopelta aegis TaxID=1735272 RepID=UPI001B88747E|nr:uncharacterized protein LOC121371594 [Gigantopelta aegis]